MKIDVYDTYATASDGRILHFEALVRSGMCPQEVEKRIHAFVGAGDPEIEMEFDRWKSSGHAAVNPAVLAIVERDGMAIVPLIRMHKAAG